MTPLRQYFIRELALRGMSPRTQVAYVAAVHRLAQYYHQAPDQLNEEELKVYLLHLAQERHLAPSSLNQHVSALRCFYDLVLHRSPEVLRRAVPRVRKAIRRPQVFSVQELERLFTVGCPHPKHRAFLMTVYGAGLRLNEACHLKPEHLDSARQQIRVEQGKGRKDRTTLLSPRLLAELRAYWRAFRPGPWLFPSSRDPQQPLPDGTAQKLFWKAVARAGLPRKGGIHSLRHSFATHLLESGVEITVVQRLLGHSNLATTSTYLHVRQERLARIQSPLQLLDLDGTPKAAQG
jgi:integrase/recombinase XerD